MADVSQSNGAFCFILVTPRWCAHVFCCFIFGFSDVSRVHLTWVFRNTAGPWWASLWQISATFLSRNVLDLSVTLKCGTDPFESPWNNLKIRMFCSFQRNGSNQSHRVWGPQSIAFSRLLSVALWMVDITNSYKNGGKISWFIKQR